MLFIADANVFVPMVEGLRHMAHDVYRSTSEGITPPSSLIRAHAPDLPAIASAQARRAGQIPPTSFSLGLVGGSLQVAVSPCWELVLPDIISAIHT